MVNTRLKPRRSSRTSAKEPSGGFPPERSEAVLPAIPKSNGATENPIQKVPLASAPQEEVKPDSLDNFSIEKPTQSSKQTNTDPQVKFFSDAVLEGQLSSNELNSVRGKQLGSIPESLAKMLINGAVDTSSL
jgi:hypothetical protein